MDTTIITRRKKAKPTLKPYAEAGYKWVVYYAGEDGTRLKRKFAQKCDAQTFYDDKLVEVENLGSRIAGALDDRVKADAYAALELLKPFGKSLVDAAKHYRAHLEATAKSAPIGTLAEQFTDSKETDGKSSRYLADLRIRLNIFVRDFGTRYASEVTAKEIQEWLGNRRCNPTPDNPDGVPVSSLTRNHYRRVLSAFFAWCFRFGYCAENPVAKVSKAKAQPGAILVYTPKEMAALLESAATWQPDRIKPEGKRGRNSVEFKHETKDLLANIVLCGFAGLRQSEFERLSWEQVKLDRGVIDLSASITKTAARRLVKIQPVLAAWLRHIAPPESGPIVQTNFSNRMTAFRERLSSPWKKNALRHSFASYLMESTQNPGEVSLQLGHNDAGVVFQHYRELVTENDAKAFWGLTPSKVLRLVPAPLPFKPEVASALAPVSGVIEQAVAS